MMLFKSRIIKNNWYILFDNMPRLYSVTELYALPQKVLASYNMIWSIQFIQFKKNCFFFLNFKIYNHVENTGVTKRFRNNHDETMFCY